MLRFLAVLLGCSMAFSALPPASAWGMAADHVERVLYWNDGSTLNRCRYDSILSGSPDIESVGMVYAGASVNFTGLGFNERSGKLLGTRNIATEGVYEIDPETGVAQLLHELSTPQFDMGGLDFDNDKGALYGLSDTAPAGLTPGLYILPDTEKEAFVAPYPPTDTDLDGLAVWEGSAYYVNDEPTGSLYVYDMESGGLLKELPTPFTAVGTFSGAAYAPGLMPGKPVTGIAQLGDWLGGIVGVEVQIRRVGSTDPIETYHVKVGTDDTYRFTTHLPAGSYAFSMKGSHWLRDTRASVVLGESGIDGLNFKLRNGDADGDNAVTVFDYNALSEAFDMGAGEPGWDPGADLDGDERATAFDYVILSNSFDEVGDR